MGNTKKEESNGRGMPWYGWPIVTTLVSGTLLLLGQFLIIAMPIFSENTGDFSVSVDSMPIEAEPLPSEILPEHIDDLRSFHGKQNKSQANVIVSDVDWLKNYRQIVSLSTNDKNNNENNLIIKFLNIEREPPREPPFKMKIFAYVINKSKSVENVPIIIEGRGADGTSHPISVYVNYDSPEDLIREGAIQLASGDYYGAIDQFDLALERDPKYALAWKWKGIAHDMSNDDYYALKSIEKAKEYDKLDNEAPRIQSIILYKKGRFIEANMALNEALILNNTSVDALYVKAFILEALGKHNDAKRVCENLTNILNLDSNFWNEIGWNSYLKGNSADFINTIKTNEFHIAVLCSEEAIRIDLNNYALDTNAAALSGLGRYDDALLILNNSSEVIPYTAMRWLHRGEILFGLGRYGEALMSYNNSSSLEPSYEAERGKASVYEELGNSTEADKANEEAEKLFKDEKSIYSNDMSIMNSELPFENYGIPKKNIEGSINIAHSSLYQGDWIIIGSVPLL
jgi:tetratricopeptide (TPR) repeat protein